MILAIKKKRDIIVKTRERGGGGGIGRGKEEEEEEEGRSYFCQGKGNNALVKENMF